MTGSDWLTTIKTHRAFLLLFFCTATLFVTNIGAYQQLLRAESNFALGARMMVESNDWLLPHAPHELPFNKPPLEYWLIGLSYKMFGFNYGASRIPSALCGLAVLACVYVLALRTLGKATGLAAAAILATSYMFWSFTRLAMPDMLLTLCVSAALVCWILVLTNQTTKPHMLALLGYGAVALGFLAKGPLAIVLSVGPVLLDILIGRDFAKLRRLHPVSGLLVFLLVGSPYLLLVYLYGGLEPLQRFFIDENLRRFTGSSYWTQEPPLFVVMTFFSNFVPWSLFFIVAIWPYFPWRRLDDTTRRISRLLFIWMIVPSVFFAIANNKLDYYFLTGMPPAALLAAHGILRADVLSPWVRRAWTVVLSALVILLPLVMILMARIVSINFPDTPLRWLPHTVAVMTCVPALVFISRRWAWLAIGAIFVSIWTTTLTAYMVFLPNYSRFQPAEVLAGSVPSTANMYVSSRVDTWQWDLALFLPTAQPITFMPDGLKSGSSLRQLSDILQTDPYAAALICERDYVEWTQAGGQLRVLVQVDAYRDNRLTLRSLLHPAHEKLYIVSR